VVQIADATKRFGSTTAVDHVSFELEPGEKLAVLGASGCGKTTLLRLIAGFEAPDEGEVRVAGKLVSGGGALVPPEDRNVGMVFQEYALFPHLSVAQNISFGLKKMAKEDRKGRLEEVLDLVMLTGLEARYPHELSGGQQQRVALARTLAPRPVTVLLDEPFSNVDATMRSDLRRDINRILRENHITTVFVTHEREEAFAMADRLAVMTDGHMDQIATPDALYHAPAARSVARMVGACDFVSGEVTGGRIETEFGSFAWQSGDQEYPDGAQVDLVVRLDDFQIVPDPKGPAEIVSREFRGDEIILTARLPSGTEVRCRQHHHSTLPTGTRVTLLPTKAAPFVAFGR
jgi:iron(III) transport system ATP-binding protein